VSGERELEQLATVLDDTATGLWMGQSGPGWGRVVAAALLPVVDRIANQRAAAVLRAAAEDVPGAATAERLRTRADELDPT